MNEFDTIEIAEPGPIIWSREAADMARRDDAFRTHLPLLAIEAYARKTQPRPELN